MEKYTRFEKINDMICENNIIKLYGEELMEVKSFCDAIFGGYVKELYSDCIENRYYVNDVANGSYGFRTLAKYISKRFGIKNIYSIHFCFQEGVLRIKNYYTDKGDN